jgi:hypothetical protein
VAVVVESFDDWYVERVEAGRDGCLEYRGMSPNADKMHHRFLSYKREMEARIKNYEKLVMIADAEVINPKSDLPNISSGETAGMIRRMARNLVQHTPNVDIVSKFDDDKAKGVFVRHILKAKIIGDDFYSNDMQQNLFASAKNSLTLGFDCVIPALLQDAAGGWYIKYDNIHYQDVFPEPGAKDIRHATDVFVRRYLTKGEVHALVRNNVAGWDISALKRLLKSSPQARETTDHQSKKHHTSPDGYEIITWYSDSGAPFLTFDARQKLLLRIEQNKHPLKWHPVFFLVMEKDLNQPLGKSQVELVMGRQEFQDLMLNGAMKMWYRNINPPLIGYGTVNAIPNLSPGKYTPISNPNAKVEAFEVNTQTLMQYGQISQQNAGNMVQLVGAADQQMATQNTGGQMSNTPQGVEAQQQMVDITTNNYQKAIESFFSRYCSYALTIYFHELRGVKEVSPTADTRQALLNGGMSAQDFDPETGRLKIDFSDLATEYFVRTVPGSLVEMEDEKQLRILNQMFVPLSQAMPAIAAAQDPEALKHATMAMQFIIEKQLELSGSTHSKSIQEIFSGGKTPELTAREEMQSVFDSKIEEITVSRTAESDQLAAAVLQIQEQIALLAQGQGAMMQQIGIPSEQSAPVAEGVPV